MPVPWCKAEAESARSARHHGSSTKYRSTNILAAFGVFSNVNRSLFLPIILAFPFLTFAVHAEAPKPPPPAQEAVRLKFVPAGGPWKGETPFQGASWTALSPGWAPGVLQLHARAGIGDRFPVQEAD